MNEENYSKREIDYHFEVVGKKLDEILEQTKKTNGRVTTLEKWKSTSVGYTGGVAGCILLIIGLCTYIFKSEIGSINAKEIETQQILTNHIQK